MPEFLATNASPRVESEGCGVNLLVLRKTSSIVVTVSHTSLLRPTTGMTVNRICPFFRILTVTVKHITQILPGSRRLPTDPFYGIGSQDEAFEARDK